jgi:hypothetical protein
MPSERQEAPRPVAMSVCLKPLADITNFEKVSAQCKSTSTR